jgi:hypothetical protein
MHRNKNLTVRFEAVKLETEMAPHIFKRLQSQKEQTHNPNTKSK